MTLIRIGVWLEHPVVTWTALLVAVLTAAMSIVGAMAADLAPHTDPLWTWPTPLVLGAAAAFLSGPRWRWALAAGALGAIATVSLWLLLAGILAAGVVCLWEWRPKSPGVLVVGRTRLGVPMRLATEDRLLHCHVMGPTGSGKSTTVLLPWMEQDLAAGLGFTLIEPKGDLCDAVYRRAIPRHGTLVRLDPTRAASPHVNILAGDGAAAGEGLALALEQVEPSGHPFYRTVGRVVLVQLTRAVAAAQGDAASVDHLLRALRDPAWRSGIVRDANLPEVSSYLAEDFGRLPPARQQELTLGLANRLQSLVLHPGLRALWSPPYDLTIPSLLADGPSWILASFPLAQLGQGARVAGTLLWHLVVQAVYARGATGHLWHSLYLDEFHQYVSPDLNDVLAMIRGYGLSVVLAHQDMGQLSRELEAAVIANARSHVILGGGPAPDRRRFEDEAAPYELPMLRYLPRGKAVYLGMRRGTARTPSMVRLPTPPRAL